MRGCGLPTWWITKQRGSYRRISIGKWRSFSETLLIMCGDDPYIFNIRADQLLRRCVSVEEAKDIMWHCHNSPYGRHFNGQRTAAKVLRVGFYWPTLFNDAYEHVQKCESCQRNFKEKWNALAKYSRSESFLLLGRWFCRTISFLVV